MNDDDDFSKYSLIGFIKTKSPKSGAPNIWDTLIHETQTRSDTSYALDSSEFYSIYQVNVTNNNELTSFSNSVIGWVSLWGDYYFIDDTDSLIINGAGLTGEIPMEIGNLVNLTYLNLSNNGLTGQIPTGDENGGIEPGPGLGDLSNLQDCRKVIIILQEK